MDKDSRLKLAVQKSGRLTDHSLDLLARCGVRHLDSYNDLPRATKLSRLGVEEDSDDATQIPDQMPYIVIIADEMADMMMTSGKEVESHIIRLAQKSRAVGIHVIVATQRPSTDVITGVLKGNLPCRIAFQVASKVDSRVILDSMGAEKLLGQGDMLYTPPQSSQIKRVQGALVALDALSLDPQSVSDTLGVLLKYQDDIARFEDGGAAAAILAEMHAEGILEHRAS